jgi:hypothetical protein
MIRAVLCAAASLVLLGSASAGPADSPGPVNPCPDGSAVTCRVNDPHGAVKPCPVPGYPPSALCLYVGGRPGDPDTHVIAKVDPLLCLHLAADTTFRRELLRSLNCLPTRPPKLAPPVAAPPAGPVAVPAPVPGTVVSDLPVTH